MSEQPLEGSAEELTDEQAIAAAAEEAGLERRDLAAADVSEADDYKPGAADLVPITGDDIYRVMDRADEIQILDELQTRPIKEMVYTFPGEGGAKITDLSYGGVREVVRTLNRGRFTAIRIDHTRLPDLTELNEDGIAYVRAMVYSADLATGSGQWGIAHEPKRMKLTAATQKKWRDKGKGDQIRESDGTVWDKFAVTKALNKAQRNAMKALLPLEFVEVVKAQFLGDVSKVREIAAGPGAEKLAEYPPPLDTPEMRQLQDVARGKYDELKEMNRMAMLPSVFDEYMTRTAHSLERVGEFIGHLEELIEVEKKRAA